METALRQYNREYKDFRYQVWQPDGVWCSLVSSDSISARQAQQFFWEQAQDRIETELVTLLDDGWEPGESIGPDAIKVRKSTRIAFRVDPADVFLWFMTLGLALIVHLFMNAPRRYTTYVPVEFRLRLQR